MNSSYFITITSLNHCGVLPAITTALSELGGDMQHASQSVIQGLFTMTIAAHFPEHRSQEVIRDHLMSAGRHYGMEVMIRSLDEVPDEEMVIGGAYFLNVSGQDAPGVLRVICGLLAQHLISIESLSALPDSPNTFSMLMRLTIPPSSELDELRAQLKEFGDLNGLLIQIQDEEAYYRSDLSQQAALHNVTRE
ncbi:MAG: hypothetical protein KDA78_17375 [Planctomycetaceae bacterium]|nr:hypothetical protein [Planctomycetaceae bacterium]